MTARPRGSTEALPRTVVGIDVETTSLDPTDGDIIEVAAIRYELQPGGSGSRRKLGREVDSLTLLAAPRQPLTDQITAITGITNDMVASAPPFKAQISAVQAFIGEDLLFAHNANFDVGYLTHHGVTIHQPVWDTFALAGAAWPTAPSYNLGTLAQQLGITVVGEHRAGDDVRLTWELLQRIYQQLQLPPDQHAVVMRLLQESKQSHYIPLFRSTSRASKQRVVPRGEPLLGVQALRAPGRGARRQAPLLTDSTITDILGPNGLLEQKIAGFAARQQQIDMAKVVETYLTAGGVGLIEAGTGTGKTYGYLVPIVHFLASRRKPPEAAKEAPAGAPSAAAGIVISTHTKSLQDQLIQHDVPLVLAALGSDATAVTLKGRRNYLCVSRLEQALGQRAPGPADAWLLIKLLCWLQTDDSGDLEQLNISHQDSRLLRSLHADGLACRQVCASRRPDCPFQRARRAARAADIVIINHALLVQLAREETIPLTHVVIDEAHHLVSTAREATRRDLGEQRVAEALAALAQLAKGEGQAHSHIREEATQLLQGYQQMLKDMSGYMQHHAGGDTMRLTTAMRRAAPWQKIMDHADAWESKLKFCLGLLTGIDVAPRLLKVRDEVMRNAELLGEEIREFTHGSPDRIQWLEYSQYRGNYELNLHDVTLSVVPYLNQAYQRAHSVILTSATLTISGDFSYMKGRIGKEDAGEHRFDSPFSFRDNMLIYIIEDSLDVKQQRYEQSIADVIYEGASLLRGRTLGLFTSHTMVKDIYFKLVKKLNKESIKLLAQKITGGRHNMVTKFRQQPESVLLGTYSFWEGMDIPGDSLSLVVIPKLPFTPPHDPIMTAVAEAEGLSAFRHLAVPDMLLKMRQGIGRLLRTTSDRGAIVLGDARILRQEYGAEVLASLPPATVKIGPRGELASALIEWFGKKVLQEWRGVDSKKSEST